MPRCGEQLGRASRPATASGAAAGSPVPPSVAPGGARELVLAAVAAGRRDRGRVAAGLALRDPRERARAAAGDWRAAPSACAGAPRCRALASVAGPAMPSTTRPWLRWKRLMARRVIGPITPSALMPSARWSGWRRPRRSPRAAARGGPVSGDAPPGDERQRRAATAPPPPAGALAPAPAAWRCARRREALQRREPRARARRIDDGHCHLLGLGAYGVSCRARAKTCATPASWRRFAPGARQAPMGPPLPASGRQGLGRVQLRRRAL